MINIIIKNYTDENSKRQPWYTARCIHQLLSDRGVDVKISDKVDERSLNIKFFSARDLLKPKAENVVYVMSFPRLTVKQFFRNIPSLLFNWRQFYAIVFVNILLRFAFLRFVKNESNALITISDSYDNLLLARKNCEKLVPYIPSISELGSVGRETQDNLRNKILYIGPALPLRGTNTVVKWINSRDSWHNYPFLLLLRNERQEIYVKTIKMLSMLKFVRPDDKICIGFLSRSEVSEELNGVRAALLPFEVVYSEFPVVILECLLKNIPVITTAYSGFSCENWGRFGIYSDLGVLDEKKIKIERESILKYVHASHTKVTDFIIEKANHVEVD